MGQLVLWVGVVGDSIDGGYHARMSGKEVAC